MIVAECNSTKNRLFNRSGYSPLQRVFGIAHRLPGDVTSDDTYVPDAIYDLAATDNDFELSRQIREASIKAHAEVSIRERIEHAVRGRRDGLENHSSISSWKMGRSRSLHRRQ